MDATLPPADLRVVTWNVWKRAGPWEQRQHAVAAELAAAAPDVVTLQQAWRADGRDQADELASAVGLGHVAWMPYPPEGNLEDRVEVGLAILSRWPIRDVASQPLPTPAARATGGRIVAGAVIDHSRVSLPVVTTHLSSDPAGSGARVQEVRAVVGLAAGLMSAAGRDGAGPVVTGDLNAEPDSDEVRLLGGLLTAPVVAGLTLADAWRYSGAARRDPGWTWRRENPYLGLGSTDGRIDYVMAGPTLRPLAAGLVGARQVDLADGAAVWPSTHAGVWADFALP